MIYAIVAVLAASTLVFAWLWCWAAERADEERILRENAQIEACFLSRRCEKLQAGRNYARDTAKRISGLYQTAIERKCEAKDKLRAIREAMQDE